MQTMINQLQLRQDYKQKLRDTCRMNKISVQVLKGLTIKKIKIFHERTLKHYSSNPEKAKGYWFQNELRLYHWLLIIHSFLFHQLLNSFKQYHWQKIHTFFPLKSIDTLQFQAKKVISSSPSQLRRCWMAQQCELLTKIMLDVNLINRWNQVSKKFYNQSGKRWYRSSKQIRQQWFNHLDHSKKHGQWTQQQDEGILMFVLENGHKWAELCRSRFVDRTEHMIKNRFKSLIIRYRPQRMNGVYNERKIIRNILLKKKNQIKQIPKSSFKIRNLRTFQTSNQGLQSPDLEQIDQPQSSLQNQLQQFSNNIPSQRQNYQNIPQPHPEPILPQQSFQPITNLSLQYQSNLYTFYPNFHQTNNYPSTTVYTTLLTNPFPSLTIPLIYTPTIPHNLF